jgi:hypothetical protein
MVDMSSSNAWAAFAGIFARTRAAYLELEHAKSELKGLMPEDAKEAVPGKALRDKFHGPPAPLTSTILSPFLRVPFPSQFLHFCFFHPVFFLGCKRPLAHRRSRR